MAQACLREQPVAQLSATELGAWRGLLRVHSALVKQLDAELSSAHRLPLSSYEVLLNLEDAPAHKRRMAELADSVLLSRSGMTRLVDRLERDGMLLTDKGAAALGEARRTHLGGVR